MRLLDVDPLTGMKTWFKGDSKEWTLFYEDPDMSGTLDHNKRLANDPENWKRGVKNEMAHYAHIPNPILLKWHTMGVNINDPRELVRMCNRPEWRYLKTTEKVHLAR